ncbi:MAG: cytochrome c maturation protein CcmE [Pseudomonadota bacterium]
MTPFRKRRLALIGIMVAGIAIAVALALNAFNQNLMFFFSPSEVLAGKAPKDHPFRIGGLVIKGSLVRQPDGLSVRFNLTDNPVTFKPEVPIHYTGLLPDLFREGQGIVALGDLGPDGVFRASQVLAKHDEKYMPPEVAKSLSAAHVKGIMDIVTQGGAP